MVRKQQRSPVRDSFGFVGYANGLPATAIAVATATAATVSAATASAVAASTASAVSTTTTLFARAGFIHFQGTAAHVGVVHGLNGSLASLVIGHGHERETARTTGLPVHDHGYVFHVAECFKGFPNLIFRSREGKVSYVQFHLSLSNGNPATSMVTDLAHEEAKVGVRVR